MVRLTFEIVGEDPSEKEAEIAKSVFRSRLTSEGYTEAFVKAENGVITVDIPKEGYDIEKTEELAELLCSNAILEFKDADENVVLDGATDIADASYEYGKTSSSGDAVPYIKIKLKRDSVAKFAEATRAAALRAAEGKNYISINLDGEVLSKPAVRSAIESETLIIEGAEFTPESAKMLASQIKSGQLPFEVKFVSEEEVKADAKENELAW